MVDSDDSTDDKEEGVIIFYLDGVSDVTGASGIITPTCVWKDTIVCVG
jgi:hypothetical protein